MHHPTWKRISVVYGNDKSLYVAFKNNGVIRISPDGTMTDTGISGGVLCLKRDRFQDIIWAGSDGQGVYLYTNFNYMPKNLTYNQIANSVVTPTRAVFLDSLNTLWMGTKGDGIVRIPAFNPKEMHENYHFTKNTAQNSLLLDDFVYAFAPSRHHVLWIGTESGLNYYSYATRKICRIATADSLQYIHSIYEQNDTTLWMASVGNGVYKATIGGTKQHPSLTHIKRYTIDSGTFNSNYFFTLTHDKQQGLLFGNRGFGVFKMKDERLIPIPYKGEYASNAVYDAFSIVTTGDTLWVGTGRGLLMKTNEQEELLGEDNDIPPSALHFIEKSNLGNLWIGTNKGLVYFNVSTGKAQVFNHSNGLRITEFSDGASFSSPQGLFFGGINGIAYIDPEFMSVNQSRYKPEICFTQVSINGDVANSKNYLRRNDDEYSLTLSPEQRAFTVWFAAPDHIMGNNFVYSYRMGDNSDWMPCEKGNYISFFNLPYGSHKLEVKYYSPISQKDSNIKTLYLHITPPFYLSQWAVFTYAILFIGVVVYTIYRYRRHIYERQQRVLDDMERSHKEEIYEEKLRFFTNITHELCTPLTLIYGPCERILAHQGIDDYVTHYTQLIKNNTERLNVLIQEIIDFRRMETGHKMINIQPIDITGLCNDIALSFADMAEENGAKFTTGIAPNTILNSDYNGITKIILNLVSNAFKYTPSDGDVRLTVCKDESNKLKLCVYNTGKGIPEEERNNIFNPYTVLDSVEENATKDLSARNGLGLAICHSIVKMLDGNIQIESEVGKYAEFVVSLPEHELGETQSENHPYPFITQFAAKPSAVTPITLEPVTACKPKIKILVVDDNPDILALLSDGLDEYEIITAQDANTALEQMHIKQPQLIITDVMMPGMNGIDMTKFIKQDRYSKHIPIIILSAKCESDNKVQGLNSGAELYISKPFRLEYLRAAIARILKSRSEMCEYYNSSASQFEYSEGKVISKEDQLFIAKVIEYIRRTYYG